MADTTVTQTPERLTWRDLFTPREPISDEDGATLDAYFRVFMKWPQNDKGESLCPGCGLSLGKGGDSGIVNFLMAGAPGRTTYEWGIAHGECQCRECGYPARSLHYNIGGEGEAALIKHLTINLPYHPDEVRRGAR